jgi:hypothetical protein
MNNNEKHLRNGTNPAVFAAVLRKAARGVSADSVTAGENQ